MDKILLVEDEKRMQEIISDYFQVKDCKVICVNQGREALSILEKERCERGTGLGLSIVRNVLKLHKMPY